MEHLHYPLDVQQGDVIEVVIDRAANVLLLDAPNYADYVSGLTFEYHGGYADVSPYRLPSPYPGHWHLAIDLGGGAGSVRASVQVVPRLSRRLGEPALR